MLIRWLHNHSLQMVATFAHDSITNPEPLLSEFEADLKQQSAHNADLAPASEPLTTAELEFSVVPALEPRSVDAAGSGSVDVLFFNQDKPLETAILSKKERRKQRRDPGATASAAARSPPSSRGSAADGTVAPPPHVDLRCARTRHLLRAVAVS